MTRDEVTIVEHGGSLKDHPMLPYVRELLRQEVVWSRMTVDATILSTHVELKREDGKQAKVCLSELLGGRTAFVAWK